MDYSAEIRYFSTKELVMTGTSDGKSEPTYSFPDDTDYDVEQIRDDSPRAAVSAVLWGGPVPRFAVVHAGDANCGHI